MIETIDALQWAGCATGVAGALLLALNTKRSGWCFVLFLISNGFWTAFGIPISSASFAMRAVNMGSSPVRVVVQGC
jgi:hypothetical protein